MGRISITCGKGWSELYNSIINAIVNHDIMIHDESKKIGIKKIYEIDGKLAVDVCNPSNLTIDIKHLIQENSRISVKTCEYCGTMRNIGTTMNIKYKTCCFNCWKNNIFAKAPSSIWRDMNGKKFNKNNMDKNVNLGSDRADTKVEEVNGTNEVNELVVINNEENDIKSPLFILFAEFLGYTSPLIDWAEKICEGLDVPTFVTKFIEVEAFDIFEKMKSEFSKKEIRTYWDEYYPIILKEYDEKLNLKCKTVNNTDDLPF